MNQVSPLDEHRDEVLALLPLQSHSAIVSTLGAKGIATSERSLRRALRRWGNPSPAQQANDAKPERELVRIGNDTAELVSAPMEVVGTPDDLIAHVGLDADEWVITDVTVNKYSMMAGKSQNNECVWMYQLKVRCARRVPYDFLLPAVESAYVAPRTPVYTWDNARLVAVMGDQQCPHLDPYLHEKACQFIESNQVDELVLTGDGLDFGDISRHSDNPEWDAVAQASINSCYATYRDYRRANEQMPIVKLLGNHDERIRARLLQFFTRLYDLRPAWLEGEDEPRRVWDVHNLLRLDDLNIDLVDPQGGYAHAQYELSHELAVRHGWIARKGAGASALATLNALGYSIFVGHTHRQALVHKTMHRINGYTATLVAVETGCMCQIKDGLGYTVAPDWQQGFATAIVWPDGTFKPELATYLDNTLMWRDQRF